MKALILTLGLLASTVRAEVIVCPAIHQDARLVGAGMYEGERREAELMGARRPVPRGIDADFGFNRGDMKWVACMYGPTTVRWYRVSAEATRCELKQRGIAPKKVSATVRCK